MDSSELVGLQKPSYTEQAKQWTARAADNLHGQAEYLKGKVVGTSGTGAPVVHLLRAALATSCLDLHCCCCQPEHEVSNTTWRHAILTC